MTTGLAGMNGNMIRANAMNNVKLQMQTGKRASSVANFGTEDLELNREWVDGVKQAISHKSTAQSMSDKATIAINALGMLTAPLAEAAALIEHWGPSTKHDTQEAAQSKIADCLHKLESILFKTYGADDKAVFGSHHKPYDAPIKKGAIPNIGNLSADEAAAMDTFVVEPYAYDDEYTINITPSDKITADFNPMSLAKLAGSLRAILTSISDKNNLPDEISTKYLELLNEGQDELNVLSDEVKKTQDISEAAVKTNDSQITEMSTNLEEYFKLNPTKAFADLKKQGNIEMLENYLQMLVDKINNDIQRNMMAAAPAG